MRLKLVTPFLLAILSLLLLDAVSATFLAPRLADFGRSLNAPTPGFGRYLALWTVFGLVAAGCLVVGLGRLVAAFELGPRLTAAWSAGTDRKWLLYGTAFAFLVPAALRTWLLDGMPLTDDEAAYRLMAQLLAQGRVYGESPPLKLFFDNRFLINDGKLFAHYFVGWPALLAPGVWLGVTGLMNALYSAATAPAVFLVARRLLGAVWARAALLLYLVSPMLMVAAATELSHTSCLAALAWLTWLVLRSRDAEAPWWVDAAVAVAFCAAFFIRPTSALGVGLPLLVAWLVGALRRPGRRRLTALAVFAAPAAVLAALFLYVNQLQTGSPFTTAYQRAYSYAAENGFRFSLWPADAETEGFTELRFADPRRSLAVTAAALFRLDVALFGWPCSLLFAFAAGVRGTRGLLWLSVLSYLALHFFTDNVGIDTFAPMHYVELAWPLLLLSAAGLATLTAAGARLDRLLAAEGGGAAWRWAPVPALAAAALCAVAAVSYLPVRLGAIHHVAEDVATPYRALREAGITRAVVFAPDPFVVYCHHPPTRGWVFARPNNDPRLRNDVLWVNHLSVQKDRLLMRRFPDRLGYVMVWDRSCKVVYLPLDGVPPGVVPDAEVAGIEEVGREPAGGGARNR